MGLKANITAGLVIATLSGCTNIDSFLNTVEPREPYTKVRSAQLSNPPVYQRILDTLDEIEYISEKGDQNYWKTPEETKREGGDCEDLAILASKLLLDEGIEHHLVRGQGNILDNAGHIWVKFQDRGKTYVLEPTIPLIYTEGNSVYYYSRESTDIKLEKHPEFLKRLHKEGLSLGYIPPENPSFKKKEKLSRLFKHSSVNL